MVASPCYTESLERGLELSCELCHDPHASVFEERERARARAGCMKCHPAAHGDPAASPAAACALPASEHDGKDCAACHMRETYVFDVAEVQIHDHEIVRRPPRSRPTVDLRVKHTRDGRLRAVQWPGQPAPAYADDPGLAMMAALAAQFPDRAMRYVDREPGELARLLPSYHHLRGTLLERAGRYDEARRAYRRALVLDPELAESEVNLALVLMRLGHFDEALARCDAVLERHPRAEGTLRNRALIRLAKGDPDGFARDLAAANAILPRELNARALATHYRRMGDEELAEFWSHQADALGPQSR
jgi:predicted CXXCH cytochrome family protein